MFTQRKLSRKNLVATGSFTAGKEGESVGAVSPAAALDRTSSASSAGKTPAFPISRKKTAGLFRSKSSKKADLDLQESSLGPAFSSSGTAASIVVNDAVRTLQLDKLATLEDESLLGDTIEKSTDGDGYSGMADYKEYINKSSAGMRAGPLRSSTYVRTSSRFDYAPDVCKDYKDSGYCGFGDSCKFMHDRTDYKSGWQLEREYEEQQKRKREPVDVIDDQNISDQELSDTDDLPFACLICRSDFVQPIVTQCGHYFCQKCALKEFVKTPKCYCCRANTRGVFNAAKNLVAKLKEKELRMQKQAAAIQEQNKHIDEEQD